MKNVTFLYCCISFFTLFFVSSCNKTAMVQPASGLNTIPTSRQSVSAALIIPGDSTVIRGDTSYGDQAALIQSRKSPYLRDNNYINFPAYNGIVWTWDGVVGNERSLMKFDLDRVPKRVRKDPPAITKALLYLYQYQRNDGLDIYGVNQTISNEVELHRIAGKWTSSTVTWNNQPALATGSANPLEDVITIPPVETPLLFNVKDNIVVDVTDMLRRMVADSSNKGFMLKITDQNENHPYCGRSFGSFACPEVNKKPKLVIYY